MMEQPMGFSEDACEQLALETLGELACQPLHGRDIAPGTGERESLAERAMRPTRDLLSQFDESARLEKAVRVQLLRLS